MPGLGSRGDGSRAARDRLAALPAADLADLIQQLTDQMHAAAAELQFELAARLRDEIGELKKELRGMEAAGRSRRGRRHSAGGNATEAAGTPGR